MSSVRPLETMISLQREGCTRKCIPLPARRTFRTGWWAPTVSRSATANRQYRDSSARAVRDRSPRCRSLATGGSSRRGFHLGLARSSELACASHAGPSRLLLAAIHQAIVQVAPAPSLDTPESPNAEDRATDQAGTFALRRERAAPAPRGRPVCAESSLLAWRPPRRSRRHLGGPVFAFWPTNRARPCTGLKAEIFQPLGEWRWRGMWGQKR